MDSIIKNKEGQTKSYLLWIGIIVYNAGLLIWDHTMKIGVTVLALLVFGILLSGASILSSLALKKEYYKDYGKFTITVFILIFLWSFFMLFNSDTKYIFSLDSYIYPYKALPYMIIVMLWVKAGDYFYTYFKISGIMSFAALALMPLAIINGSNFIQIVFETFSIFAAYVFLTSKYQTSKKILFSLFVLVVTFLVATYMGRRNLMLTSGLYLMIGFLWLLKDGKLKSLEAKFIVVISCVLVLLGGIYYYSSGNTFKTFKGRATSNTREEVFVMYFADMANPKDLLVGRGIFGEYYGPNVDKDTETGEYSDYRDVIECGYLQLILKGGVVYLVLYLILFIIAILRGKNAKNRLLKACTVIVFVQIIDMLPFGLHAFNTKAILIWLSVSVCLNKRFVEMTDDEISNLFFRKKITLLPWNKK